MQNLSNCLMNRSSQISQISLNQERYVLEVKKLEKELAVVKSLTANSENFISIKSTLEKVFKEDQQFCRTFASEDEFENLEDIELTQIVNFILKDFVFSKKQMMKDLQICQSRQSDNLGKMASLHRTFTTKFNEKEEKYRRCIEVLQNNNKKLLSHAGNDIKGEAAIEILSQFKVREDDHLSQISKLKLQLTKQEKLVEVLQKCTTVMDNKLNAVSKSGKQNNGDKIIVGKKILTRNGGSNDSEIIKILTSELSMRDKMQYATVQKFVQQLNKYKSEVSILNTCFIIKISKYSNFSIPFK